MSRVNFFKVCFSAQAEAEARRATTSDEEHFVDIHCNALIQLVHPVAPILDDLKQWRLLKREQYYKVRGKETPQDQMRELFAYVDSWGNEDKDKFLESLREHNEPLIRRLEQGQMESRMDVR